MFRTTAEFGFPSRLKKIATGFPAPDRCRMRLLLACILLITLGCPCYGNETRECSVAQVRPGNIKARVRSLEFATPVTNGQRVSRCYGSGTPSCPAEESQSVADVYCQGVGFEYAAFWQAASVNETFCFPEITGLDGSTCDNFAGQCQAFGKIICTGPKIVRGFIEAGSGFGVVEFKQDGKDAPIEVVFRVDGLPKGDLDFAIHDQRVADGCAGTGKEVKCNDQKNCGDISGRMGKLRGPKVTDVLQDKKGGLTLFGERSIEGRSMVFRDRKGRRISCGSLHQRSQITLPDALVPVVEAGEASSEGFTGGIFQAKIPTPKKKATPELVAKSALEIPSQPSVPASTHPLPNSPPMPGALPLVTLQPAMQTLVPNSLSRCPFGKTCPTRKCRTNCDNMQTCCRCMRWLTSDGSCAPDGWIKLQGSGNCEFSTDCPPGVVCLGVKKLQTLTKDGFDETCCECFAHNPDGSCQPGAFKFVRGSGECSFGVDPSLLKSLSSNSGALPQGD